MSDADADISSASQPTIAFKRKKRPAAARSHHRASSNEAARGADGTTRAETPLSGFEGDTEDSTSETLEELLALRRLKRLTAGLELEKLNSGEKRKRVRPVAEGDASGQVLENGMIEGTHGGLRGGAAAGDRIRDDSEGPEAKARKIIKTDNFTGQTNTVDVDKHMLAYIEAELAKKRGEASGSSADPSSNPSRPHDPRDELYRVAEKYRFADITEQEGKKKERDEEEGNVTLSTGMLMGIPEVDLGIDTKLKNIEATEKAKRALREGPRPGSGPAEAAGLPPDKDQFAVDRFYRHRRPLESDHSALAHARYVAANPPETDPDAELRKRKPGRETATDEMAVARFKKRQMQQWGGKK
ncbi:hypothetical protein Rt10032_c07g3008 [Rhodotorula toruloides]|uniref:Uncharacterized protein n=1 Tax=Rhodotorula toruloides TaxID=5286 RepID=A0A511KF48_RHOTO|nr:hypothetical protein Rt10032_c07g3008 [Rhodotorula toruloides]